MFVYNFIILLSGYQHIGWYVLLVFTMALWSMSYPFVQWTEGMLTPLQLAFLRFLWATIVLIPWCRDAAALRRLSLSDWGAFSGIAALVSIATCCIVYGIYLSSTMHSAIIVNTNPLAAAVIAALVLGERLTVQRFVCVLLGLLGVFFVILDGESLSSLWSSDMLLGSLFCLFATIIIAFSTVWSKSYVQQYGGLFLVCVTNGIATILLCIALLIQQEFLPILHQPLWLHGIVFLYGVVATAVPWSLFAHCLRFLDVAVVSSFKFLIPVFATLFALLWFDAVLSIWIMLGMLCIAVAVRGVSRGMR